MLDAGKEMKRCKRQKVKRDGREKTWTEQMEMWMGNKTKRMKNRWKENNIKWEKME